MKTLTNHYYETAPVIDDMTHATISFIGMAIALGLVADPDYRYELKGFTPEETTAISQEVARRMARMIPIDWDIQGADDTHFLGDRTGEMAA
jgi:hypothetical protein